jgi:hypothetical protein
MTSCGVSARVARGFAMSGKGVCRIYTTSGLQRASSIEVLASEGLFRLEQRWVELASRSNPGPSIAWLCSSTLPRWGEDHALTQESRSCVATGDQAEFGFGQGENNDTQLGRWRQQIL